MPELREQFLTPKVGNAVCRHRAANPVTLSAGTIELTEAELADRRDRLPRDGLSGRQVRP